MRALCLLGVFFAVGAQDDEARNLVERAITARGGADNVARTQLTVEKTKGSLFVGTDSIACQGESTMQFPGQLRMVFKVKIKGEEYSQVRVLDGDKGWTVDIKGESHELAGKELEEFRQDLFHDNLLRLLPLRDKELKLTLLGERKVLGKVARGLKVSAAGKRDLELYFDKETNLLVKLAREGFDAEANRLVSQEQYFSDYRAIDGVQYPTKWINYQDDRKMMELEVTEVRFPSSVPATTFAKPMAK